MLTLAPDTTLHLPSVTVLRASAGSGKTYTLTARYVQFLLSTRVKPNDLRSILAITFANNASREMRQKVLAWLKHLHAGHKQKLTDIGDVIAEGPARAREAAGPLIEQLIDRYSDFQVRTIDSFMAAIFRASAVEFGYGPELEIVLEQDTLIDYAFTLWLREAREGSARGALVDRVVREKLAFAGEDDSFPWDPASKLRSELKELEGRLGSVEKEVAVDDLHDAVEAMGDEARRALERVAALVEPSGLTPNGKSTFPRLLAAARARRYGGLLYPGTTPPVNKAKKKADEAAYDSVRAAWEEAYRLMSAYTAGWARAWFGPMLRLRGDFSDTLSRVKRAQGKVFIDDIGAALGEALAVEAVPEVYFRLGERIWHYMVDEFQDTSPLQWRALFLLVENSLSVGGSFFAVGDTKQAIYGFRHADYRIMKELEQENPFPAASHHMDELTVNHRSRPRVLALARAVFPAPAATEGKWAEAAHLSGLDNWHQDAEEGEGEGYAEVVVLDRDDDACPERAQLVQTLRDLHARGYAWGDIALLASKNDEIVRATGWLNEESIPFVSYSSLDVRGRPVAQEMLALLAFLDSPPDDLAFAAFLAGGLFASAAAEVLPGFDAAQLHSWLFRARKQGPLYKSFQRDFPALWQKIFSQLFRAAGYLPLYDLVSEACTQLRAFARVPGEEAALAKLLEAVTAFEGETGGSLRDFLERDNGESSTAWSMQVPVGLDAVQAMTVHKAKGLGFPVVIAMLYASGRSGVSSGFIAEPDGRARLVRVNADLAEYDIALAAAKEQEDTRQAVDRMNALYVALTRAHQEMYVIGVKKEKDTFPFDLLPAEGFSPRAEKEPPVRSGREGDPKAKLSHDTQSLSMELAEGLLSAAERRRGELVHRVLELAGGASLETLEEALAAAADRAAREAREPPEEARLLLPALAALVRGTAVAATFEPGPAGRRVLLEQEFCDRAGRLFRMDRVVVDPDRVTVVDWKTGAEEPAQHEAQIRGYMDILAEAWPGRAVTGILAYVDHGSAREVGT